MLKGKRQLARSVVPDSTVALSHRQLRAYTAAFAAISPEFDEMQEMGQQVRNLPRSIMEPAAESSGAASTITVEGIGWQSQTRLLKLPKSTIYLCRHPTENEFAIIQQFPAESAYAKANGQSEILLRNDDSRQLVSEYVGWAQHTMRFMASNLVARAQRVAFEQFPEYNPGNIVHAISERCLHAVGESLTVMESVGQATRQSRGIRI
jgi:flagellar biosynthesis component FlhA